MATFIVKVKILPGVSHYYNWPYFISRLLDWMPYLMSISHQFFSKLLYIKLKKTMLDSILLWNLGLCSTVLWTTHLRKLILTSATEQCTYMCSQILIGTCSIFGLLLWTLYIASDNFVLTLTSTSLEPFISMIVTLFIVFLLCDST